MISLFYAIAAVMFIRFGVELAPIIHDSKPAICDQIPDSAPANERITAPEAGNADNH